jgi:cell division protein FtsB
MQQRSEKREHRNLTRAKRLLGDLKLKSHIIAGLEKENEELKKEVNKLKDDATFYHTQWGKEIDLCKDLKRELEYAKKRKWWMIWSL